MISGEVRVSVPGEKFSNICTITFPDPLNGEIYMQMVLDFLKSSDRFDLVTPNDGRQTPDPQCP